MQLPQEILKQVRLLTDKPISPKVNKQLLPLLLHENLPLEQCISALCLKFRADLIIYLLQNKRFPSKACLHNMLSSMVNNIMKYKSSEMAQVWLLVLMEQKDEMKMLEIGYLWLAKLAIKQPNLQTKQAVFKIIGSNYEYFYKCKAKKIVRACASNYLQLFNKFLIYVPSYPTIIQLILNTDKQSKQLINSPHPERQNNLQDIFIDLSSKELSWIKNQIILLLENTKDKANFYSLHRSCLKVLYKIAQILNIFKVKQAELEFKEIDIGKILKVIQGFVGRKGTIDEARVAKTQWIKRAEETKKIREAKSQKILDLDSFSKFLPNKDKPVFIEDVISMTNNYRLKYQVDPENKESGKSNIVSVANVFLKKGGGGGGGRTSLMDESSVSHKKNVEIKNKRKYDGLVDKCFSEYQSDLVYKSFVDPSVEIIKEHLPPVHLALDEEKVENTSIMHENVEQDFDMNNLPAFSSFSYQKYQKTPNESRIKNSNQRSRLIEDDDEVEEISNLIDLAYSYKFS